LNIKKGRVGRNNWKESKRQRSQKKGGDEVSLE